MEMEGTKMQIGIDYAVLGALYTNCYLLKNETDKQCVLVDPADNIDVIQKMVAASGCTLQGILLTHGHFDHMLAAEAARDFFGVKIYAGIEEQCVLAQPDFNQSADLGGNPISLKADVWLSDGQELSLAGIDIKVIHTPGHTCGGVCYYIAAADLLFSGDTLFAESVGRSDFPTGSMSALVRSVKEKLLVLPKDTKVLTGHGESTSIDYERKYNPYCQ